MNKSDLRVEHVEVDFGDETLASPLRLSKGDIEAITSVRVTIAARTRDGRPVQGIGAILLSDVWAFPGGAFTHAQKDDAMRALCMALAAWLSQDDWGDALEKGMRLEAALGRVTQEAAAAQRDNAPDRARVLAALPRLAQLICLAPFDAALHDAWGRGLGRPVYACYDGAALNRDLGDYLGPDFAGRYPGDYLAAPRAALRVQHVVGVGDALGALPAEDAQDAHTDPPRMGLPGDLVGWILRDGVSAFKLKTRGQDPAEDAARVVETYRSAYAALTHRGLDGRRLRLSVDPNEGCPDPAILLEMLDRLAQDAPDALASLDYIEQPTGRDLSAYDFTLHDVARRVPVIIDESLESLDILPHLAEQGWSGLAVKTCKGHTHALLAYCWAKQHGQTVTLQDLTNIGYALVHSANLCAHLDLSFDYFECNQRQYLPHAQPAVRAAYPAYFNVEEGMLHLPGSMSPGLY